MWYPWRGNHCFDWRRWSQLCHSVGRWELKSFCLNILNLVHQPIRPPPQTNSCVHQQKIAGITSMALSRSCPDCRRIDKDMPALNFLPLGWDKYDLFFCAGICCCWRIGWLVPEFCADAPSWGRGLGSRSQPSYCSERCFRGFHPGRKAQGVRRIGRSNYKKWGEELWLKRHVFYRMMHPFLLIDNHDNGFWIVILIIFLDIFLDNHNWAKLELQSLEHIRCLNITLTHGISG